jgi:hypothetical protein
MQGQRKQKLEDFKVFHNYNKKPNAPSLEDIIHNKEFVKMLYYLVVKYSK